MKSVRFLAMLLAVLMVVGMFSSCAELEHMLSHPETSTPTSESEETGESTETSAPPTVETTMETEEPTEETVDVPPETTEEVKPTETEAPKPVHQHNFQNPTCTKGGVCSCGAVGDPLGHNYSGASCTKGGTCSRCGATGNPMGHSFSSATCTKAATCTRCGATGDAATGHNYSNGRCTKCGDTNGPLSPSEAKWFDNYLTDEQNAEALAVARKIAASIPAGTDLERVSAAARAVSGYYYQGVHKESGSFYNQAYGVFIKGESSCAGCTRALGLVLSVMGYSWKHANEYQWSHQWVILTMDGQIGYADGQVGWAGYGKHPVDES